MKFPEFRENFMWDALDHALSQLNIWSDEIIEHSINKHENDDSDPFAGHILESSNGELQYTTYFSIFDFNKKIVGYVNAFWVQDEMVFSYALAEQYLNTIDHSMLQEYCNVQFTKTGASNFRWHVSRLKTPN